MQRLWKRLRNGMNAFRMAVMLGLFLNSLLCHADKTASPNSLSLGVIAGVGSTSWSGMVPRKENQNAALALSTPLNAKEGGGVWGGFMSYELSRHFMLELNYLHFPSARIQFDEFSLYAFEHDGKTLLKTNTDTLTFAGKIMMPLAHPNYRLYSGAGISRLRRVDSSVNRGKYTPSFLLGLNVDIQPQWSAELSAQLTTGYGEANLNPANSYLPFLYALMVKLAYHL